MRVGAHATSAASFAKTRLLKSHHSGARQLGSVIQKAVRQCASAFVF